MAPRSGLSPDRGADFCAEHVLKHESPGRKSSREDEGEGEGERLGDFWLGVMAKEEGEK